MSERQNNVFRIILSPLQAQQFQELLNRSRAKTGVEGILCTVARCYVSASGGSIVELQAARLSRGAMRKIQKIFEDEFSPPVAAEQAGEVPTPFN
jgi:hypothetical protein